MGCQGPPGLLGDLPLQRLGLRRLVSAASSHTFVPTTGYQVCQLQGSSLSNINSSSNNEPATKTADNPETHTFDHYTLAWSKCLPLQLPGQGSQLLLHPLLFHLATMCLKELEKARNIEQELHSRLKSLTLS